MRWLDGITDSMGMTLSKVWETAEDRGTRCATSMGSQRIGHDVATEQQQITNKKMNVLKTNGLKKILRQIPSQFSSVTQSCLTLCDPIDCSRPGLPVYHQLPEFTQTHVH